MLRVGDSPPGPPEARDGASPLPEPPTDTGLLGMRVETLSSQEREAEGGIGDGMTAADLDDYTWINDSAKADKVAKALLKWGLDAGASSFCHWFQPMTSTFRHGDTGQVQMSMLEFNRDGTTDKRKFFLGGENPAGSYKNPILMAGDVVRVNDSPLSATVTILNEITGPAVGVYSVYSLFNDFQN